MEPSPPKPPHIVTKAPISPRPNSNVSHSYPPHSDDWSERGENCSYSHAPIPTPLTGVGHERELPGDRSRAALDRQGYHGPPPMPTDRLRSRDNDRYSSARNPARPLGPDRWLPACNHWGSPGSPRKGPGGEQAMCYQGAPQYHGEHPLSYKSQQFLYAGACQHWSQHGPRDSYHQGWQSYASPGTAYTSPWSFYGHQSVRPAPTWYQPGQPLPGHHCGTRQQCDYTPSRPNWHSSSSQAQALAWEHANGSGCGSSSLPPAGNPPTAQNPSASDSSAAEANPKDCDDSAARSKGAPVPYRDNQYAPASSATTRTGMEATPSTSGVPPRSWTSSPRDHEGERPESLYSVDEERDDSFTSALDPIRRVNIFEKPAGVTPSRGRTTVAMRRGLQSEPSPALHLPPSELLKALVGDVNSTLDKFIEEQTPNAFIPLQMKRQRRYYCTSEPVLAVPYAVTPGLVLLMLDKATEP